MTKAERLLYIINLFRVRKKITLEQLSEECGVSRRTIYRDLDSLSMLNIPIFCDNGYSLARDITLPPLNLAADELEIIGYSLETSDLMNSPRFRDILKRIELKIASAVPKHKDHVLNRRLHGIRKKYQPVGRKQDKIISKFFSALLKEFPVYLLITGEDRNFHEFIPVGLIVSGSRWSLKFRPPDSKKCRVVSIGRIEGIKVSKKK